MTRYICLHDYLIGNYLAFKKDRIYTASDTCIIGRDKTAYNKSNFPDFNSLFQKIDIEDPVNHPSHYSWLKEVCGIEVIDITRHLDFDLGNAIKYILRAGRKDKSKTIEDLEKAIFYINDRIKLLKDEKY